MNKIVKYMPSHMNSKNKLNSGQLRECIKAFLNVLANDLTPDEYRVFVDAHNLEFTKACMKKFYADAGVKRP